MAKEVQIVCVSDIHNHLFSEDEMPCGDILIIAGDATKRGTQTDFAIFKKNLWKWDEEFKYIIYVPGKHDRLMETKYWDTHDYLTEVPSLHILVNTSIVLMGLKIWGSPVSKYDANWAFTEKDPARKELFETIPDDTDILVTYSPAQGILDTIYLNKKTTQNIGCQYILEALTRIRPQLHVCGSAHESYGAAKDDEIMFINASLVNKDFQPKNPVVMHPVISKA